MQFTLIPTLAGSALGLSCWPPQPWHVLHVEDEGFYVIVGELEAQVGESPVRLGAGDFGFGPRDVPHGFRITSATPARLLLITVGGCFSDFIAASAQTYGQEILGPCRVER